MSRINISQASKKFNVSRNTLYKYIKSGKLTKDENGLVDTSDLIRLFGSHVNSQQPSTQDDTENEHNIAQYQHRERIKQGLERSGYKPTGKKADTAKHERIKALLATEAMTKEEIAKVVGCGVATVYRVIKGM